MITFESSKIAYCPDVGLCEDGTIRANGFLTVNNKQKLI